MSWAYQPLTPGAALLNGTPLIETLTDDFDDNSLSAQWTEWFTGFYNETSQQLQITSNTSPEYRGGVSTGSYQLTDSSTYIEVVHALTGLTDAGTFYQVLVDASHTITFYVYNGTLIAEYQISGVYTTVASGTYNSTSHRWWRIRETSGTLYYEVSADGVSWSTFASVATPFNVDLAQLSIFIGTDSANGSTDTAIFDNQNTPPSAVVLSVADAFWSFVADNGAITQNHSLSVADASWTFVADNTTINQNHVLTAQDAFWEFIGDEATLSLPAVLQVQDAFWTFHADNGTITQNHALSAQEAYFDFIAGTVDIQQNTALTVADAFWLFVADTVTVERFRRPPTRYAAIAKPDTSYECPAKPDTPYALLPKPDTSYETNLALETGVTLDSATVTLADLNTYLHGYSALVPPRYSTRSNTSYSDIAKPKTAYLREI